MTTNEEVAEILTAIGDLLELQGERFKPEAYRRAARSIEGAGEDLRTIQARGGLSEIPAVGDAIQKKIEEFLATGHIHYYDELRAAVPPGVVALMRLSGVGPKTAARFLRELGIDSPGGLLTAIDQGRLNGVKGFGTRKIENLKAAASTARPPPLGRLPLRTAADLANQIVATLSGRPDVREIEVAGSLRRRRASVGDLDLLVTSDEPVAVIDAFAKLPGVLEILVKGDTKCSVVHQPGVQIDLRVVPGESFGAALQYFTGSKDHNVRLRSLAKDQGLRINEYGVTRGEERIAGRTEEEVYRSVGLPWIPPELRENQGEFEAASEGRLPRLLEPGDLTAELHEHLPTDPQRWALRDRVEAARARHLRYVGVVLPTASGLPKEAGVVTELRRSWQNLVGDAGPRLLVGLEVPLREADLPTPATDAYDYLVLDATGVPSPPSPLPVPAAGKGALRFVGHLALGDPGSEAVIPAAREWIAWCRAAGASLEVTARGAENGADAGTLRAAVAAKVGVVVSGSLGDNPGLGGVDLAVGIARRGWVTAISVPNAQKNLAETLSR